MNKNYAERSFSTLGGVGGLDICMKQICENMDFIRRQLPLIAESIRTLEERIKQIEAKTGDQLAAHEDS